MTSIPEFAQTGIFQFELISRFHPSRKKQTMDTSAPTAGAAPMEAAAEAQPPMERLSEAVAKNPLDFDSWTQLLALVESEVHPSCAAILSFAVHVLTARLVVRPGGDAARDGRGDVRPLLG